MADTEKDILFMGVGFLGALFLMTHFTSLRPAGVARFGAMSNVGMLNVPATTTYNPRQTTPKRFGASAGYDYYPSSYSNPYFPSYADYPAQNVNEVNPANRIIIPDYYPGSIDIPGGGRIPINPYVGLARYTDYARYPYYNPYAYTRYIPSYADYPIYNPNEVNPVDRMVYPPLAYSPNYADYPVTSPITYDPVRRI